MKNLNTVNCAEGGCIRYSLNVPAEGGPCNIVTSPPALTICAFPEMVVPIEFWKIVLDAMK